MNAKLPKQKWSESPWFAIHVGLLLIFAPVIIWVVWEVFWAMLGA